jgi:hypothetical protein
MVTAKLCIVDNLYCDIQFGDPWCKHGIMGHMPNHKLFTKRCIYQYHKASIWFAFCLGFIHNPETDVINDWWQQFTVANITSIFKLLSLLYSFFLHLLSLNCPKNQDKWGLGYSSYDLKIFLDLCPCLELLTPHPPICLFPTKTKQAKNIFLVFHVLSHT